MKSQQVHFSGPLTFGAGDRCLFESALSDVACVYLWTIRRDPDGVHLIHYVGEASAFAQRQREHLIHMLGLNYGAFDLESARRGESRLVWPGLWRDKSVTAPASALNHHVFLAPKVVEYIEAITVFVAPLDGGRDFRRHVEGSIARALRTGHPDDCALYPSDNRTGVRPQPIGVRLEISSDETIAGLDSVLDV